MKTNNIYIYIVYTIIIKRQRKSKRLIVLIVPGSLSKVKKKKNVQPIATGITLPPVYRKSKSREELVWVPDAIVLIYEGRVYANRTCSNDFRLIVDHG